MIINRIRFTNFFLFKVFNYTISLTFNIYPFFLDNLLRFEERLSKKESCSAVYPSKLKEEPTEDTMGLENPKILVKTNDFRNYTPEDIFILAGNGKEVDIGSGIGATAVVDVGFHPPNEAGISF